MSMKHQAGVAVPAELHDHFVQPTGGNVDMGADARVVAPDAVIGRDSHSSSATAAAAAGLDGHLVDPKYAHGVSDAVGGAYGVEGVKGTHGTSTGAGMHTYGDEIDTYNSKTGATSTGTYGTHTDTHGRHDSDKYSDAEHKGGKEKTGLVGKIKNKLHI